MTASCSTIRRSSRACKRSLLEQPASLKPYQQDLYMAVRAEPTLAHVLVATPSIDWFGGFLSVGDLDNHHWPLPGESGLMSCEVVPGSVLQSLARW